MKLVMISSVCLCVCVFSDMLNKSETFCMTANGFM